MWLYQELLVQLRPALVVEFGSFQGGSALYFATVLSALPPQQLSERSTPHRFKVVTVDVRGDLLHPTVAADSRIEAITASSTDPSVENRIRQLLLE
jgi:cephalosporin hydroxylase